MNEEGILLAFGYNANDATLKQLRAILSRCDFEQTELEKIVALNDKLKTYGAYIAMSNSNNYFKIKNESPDKHIREAVREAIFSWSDKNKRKLEKVEGKETYYITDRF